MRRRSGASAMERVCKVPSYKTSAIVLKKTKLKEKDLILTLLGEKGEQIRAVAKGAQRPGGSFAARLEVFSVVDLMLYEGKNLHTVTDARIIESNEECRADVTRLSYGAVMAELIEKTSLEGQEMPVSFALARTALGSLGRVSETALPFVVSAFLIKLLAYLGYRPSFDECTYCGRSRAEAADGAASGEDLPSSDAQAGKASAGVFSISSGGWVCDGCAFENGIARNEMVSSQTVSWARSLMGMRFLQLEELFSNGAMGMQPGAAKSASGCAESCPDVCASSGEGTCSDPALFALGGSLLSFCEQWIGEHLGIRMKSMGFLSRLHI